MTLRLSTFLDVTVLWCECLVGPALVLDLLGRGVPKPVALLVGGFVGAAMMAGFHDVLRKGSR